MHITESSNVLVICMYAAPPPPPPLHGCPDSLARTVWPQTFWPKFSAKVDSLAKPV